jgi:predicted molibdopterin-dependent oxidoreductase YjgC
MLTRPTVPGAARVGALHTPTGPADLTIWFDGHAIPARSGDSVAVALLAAGIIATRTTAISGAPRGPFCMMGACFECLATVDGRANVQTCMTLVRDGMRVEQQDGARSIPMT